MSSANPRSTHCTHHQQRSDGGQRRIVRLRHDSARPSQDAPPHRGPIYNGFDHQPTKQELPPAVRREEGHVTPSEGTSTKVWRSAGRAEIQVRARELLLTGRPISIALAHADHGRNVQARAGRARVTHGTGDRDHLNSGGGSCQRQLKHSCLSPRCCWLR
jgi:hypothetical protein